MKKLMYDFEVCGIPHTVQIESTLFYCKIYLDDHLVVKHEKKYPLSKKFFFYEIMLEACSVIVVVDISDEIETKYDCYVDNISITTGEELAELKRKEERILEKGFKNYISTNFKKTVSMPFAMYLGFLAPILKEQKSWITILLTSLLLTPLIPFFTLLFILFDWLKIKRVLKKWDLQFINCV